MKPLLTRPDFNLQPTRIIIVDEFTEFQDHKSLLSQVRSNDFSRSPPSLIAVLMNIRYSPHPKLLSHLGRGALREYLMSPPNRYKDK